MNKIIKRLLRLPSVMFLFAKYGHLELVVCPICCNELYLKVDEIRLIVEIPGSHIICEYCEQDFELDGDIFIEYTFQNKSLRQALYGHYMEWLPTDLLSVFKAYCDEHPNYDWKHIKGVSNE